MIMNACNNSYSQKHSTTVHVHMYMYIYTYMFICIYIHMYMHVNVCTYVCTCTYMYIRTCILVGWSINHELRVISHVYAKLSGS